MGEKHKSYEELVDPDNEVAREVRERYPVSADTGPEILERLRSGDHEAFRYVYLHYFDSLLGFLSVILRSREEAEEITQNVFANIWEKRESIEPDKGIKRILYRQAKYLAFNYFKHSKIKGKYSQYAAVSAGGDMSLSAEELVENEEVAILIELALQRMPDKRREIFQLSRDEGLTYDEIAERLGISRDTVKYHIGVAIRDLKEVIAMFVVLFLS